jgi:hypothetical protein
MIVMMRKKKLNLKTIKNKEIARFRIYFSEIYRKSIFINRKNNHYAAY